MLNTHYISGILVALFSVSGFAGEVEKPGTEPSKGSETRTPFLPIIAGVTADSAAIMPDSIYSSKTIKGKTPAKKKVYQFKIQDEINASTLRQTEEMLVNAENMDADYILIHLSAEGGNYTAANKIKNSLMHSKTPVLMYIDNKIETSGAIVSLGADSIITSKNIQIGKVTVTTDKVSNKSKSYQYYVKTLLLNTASKTENIASVTAAANRRSFTSAFTDPYEQQYANAELNTALNDAGLNNYDIIEYKTSHVGAFMDNITSENGAAAISFIITALLILFLRTNKKGIALCLIFIFSLIYFASSYFENSLSGIAALTFYSSLILLVLGIALKFKTYFSETVSVVLISALLFNHGLLIPMFISVLVAIISCIGILSAYQMLHKNISAHSITSNFALHETNLETD